MKTPSVPTSFKAINDLVGAHLVTLITAYNQTSLQDVEGATDYIASVIRQGTFQDDPVKRGISILVCPDDPEDTSADPHLADTDTDTTTLNEMDVPVHEIGGGTRRWLHFTIIIKIYEIKAKKDRDEARQVGLWVIGRAEQAIRENRALNGLEDDFGEKALYMECKRSQRREQGGPQSSFIWEGRLRVSVLTSSDEIL